MQTKELKVMVLGPRCGKSTFINNICNLNNDFDSKTLGCSVNCFDIFTNVGKRRLNLWEVGSEYQGLKKDYCKNVDFAIIFRRNNEHLEFENWLENNVPRVYVDNYNTSQDINIINDITDLVVNNLI
jgi:hypothetical protein